MIITDLTKRQMKMYELHIKQEAYPIENIDRQNQVIEILKAFEKSIPETFFKRKIDEILYSFKSDYFDKIDYVIRDIFEGKMKKSDSKKVDALIKEMTIAAGGTNKSTDELETIFKGS